MEESEEKHDYFVRARLSVQGKSVEGVPCKVFLPATPGGKPRLAFTPDRSQKGVFEIDYKGEFHAELRDLNGRSTRLDSPCMYFGSCRTQHWGPDLTYITASGDPQDLHVVKELSSSDAATSVCFWISPSQVLSPQGFLSKSYDGDVKFEPLDQKSFDLGDGVVLNMRRNYVDLPCPREEIRRAWHLVADCPYNGDVECTAHIKEVLLSRLDEFLAVASFVSRQRTMCVGWAGHSGVRWTRFYRGHITSPGPAQRELTSEERLVGMKDVEECVRSVYARLRTMERQEKAAMLSCMYKLTAPTKSLEARYLSLFSALETLILMHRRLNTMEFVLDPNGEAWDDTCKAVRKAIKSTGKLSPVQRKLMYEKLPELNRVRLETAATDFMNRYGIEIGDLWPLFDVGGLAVIRNLLIHGDTFPEDLFRSLATASDYLEWLLERAVLRVAGWDVERSQVRTTFLKAVGLTSVARLEQDYRAVRVWCESNGR